MLFNNNLSCQTDASNSPLISVSNAQFNSVDVYKYAFKNITVKNIGKDILIIDGVKMPKTAGAKIIFKSIDIDLEDISKSHPLVLNPGESKIFQVKFLPEKQKKYIDSITFLSNTYRNPNSPISKIDSAAILTGNGVEPKFVAGDMNWKRKRVHRTEYPVVPYSGNFYLSNVTSEVNSLDSLIYDPVVIDGEPTFYIDRKSIFGYLFGSYARKQVLATFFPRKIGWDTCITRFKTMLGYDTVSYLYGFGVLPKMEASDANIYANSNHAPYNPALGKIVITNLNHVKWDYYDTLYIYDFIEENISPDNKNWNDNHFRYDKSLIKFPIKLNPGQAATIPIYYKSELTEPVSGYLTTKSDAIEEITVKVTGYPYGTDVEDVDYSNELVITPNPADDELHISNIPYNCQKIVIINVFGETVKIFETKGMKDYTSIYVAELSSGFYLLRIFYGQNITEGKFMVLR